MKIQTRHNFGIHCDIAAAPSPHAGCTPSTALPTGVVLVGPASQSVGEVGDLEICFAQDNAPCHKGKVATTFLAANQVRVLQWPPLSPDLSIVENVWSEVKRLVDRKRPRTADQIETAAKRAWLDVTGDQAYVSALYGSIGRRLQAVKREKGGAIDN